MKKSGWKRRRVREGRNWVFFFGEGLFVDLQGGLKREWIE